MATKTKRTKKKTTKKAAHIGAAINAKVLAVIKRAGKQYASVAQIKKATGVSESWVAVTVRKLRDEGHAIESKRGIGGGYRIG